MLGRGPDPAAIVGADFGRLARKEDGQPRPREGAIANAPVPRCPPHLEEGTVDPGDFSRFDPIPRDAIERAVAIMQSGKIFRYAGASPEESEAALFERDFAAYLGVRHALGVSSCSQAILLALILAGVRPGARVLVPGFTFTAVPSAIVILGATPVFVECTEDYRLDIDDLARRITPETKVLLLSHMRGHAPDMDAVGEICARRGIALIEDAAHALGSRWRGKPLGSFGRIGCFSFQSNKIINAGEGGMLVTDDEDMIAKAICLSGAYERNFKQHFVDGVPFAAIAGALPLHNARMTNLTAAIARPQLATLEWKAETFRRLYAGIVSGLADVGRIVWPAENPNQIRVPDSLQFRVDGFTETQLGAFADHVRRRGLPLMAFGDADNARAFYNWRYLDGAMPTLPRTRRAIANAFDMRLVATMSRSHLSYLVATLRAAVDEAERS